MDLAARQWLQEFFFLRHAGESVEDAGDKVVDRDDGRARAIAGGDLFAGDGERGVIEARAAPLLGDRHAVETHRAEAFQRLARELLLAVPARRVRRELALR